MANFETRTEFRLEGQSELLFAIESLGHDLREGDQFFYDLDGGAAVEYKVEKSRLMLSHRDVSPDANRWHAPVLKIEVSVVP